mgnify:FL=1
MPKITKKDRTDDLSTLGALNRVMETDTSVTRCTECGSRDLVIDETRGEKICSDCGLVLEDFAIDHGAEWRVFSTEQGDKLSRTGAPANTMIHDKGLSTDIDWQNKDYSGKAIKSGTRSQFYRMRKWQKRARTNSSKERNLQVALSEMDKVGSALGFGKSAKEYAGNIYRKALEQNMLRGRSIDAMVAACLHVANQELRLARTLDDIARASRLGTKEISRTHRMIKRELKLRTKLVKPEDYVGRFCSLLGHEPKVVSKTMEIIEKATAKEMVYGKSPSGVAAASIYIAGVLCDRRRTQRDIAHVSSVTEVTIRNRYKELVKGLGLEGFEV